MRTCNDIYNEIRERVYNVFKRGLERDEITILVPQNDYEELCLIRTHLIFENKVMCSNGTEVVKLMGVTLQPVKDIDKIYVCL